MERIIVAKDYGRFVGREGNDFVVWDRHKKDFVRAGGIELKKRDSTLNHLRDLYAIGRKYGVGKALSYDWGGTKSNMKMRVLSILDDLEI